MATKRKLYEWPKLRYAAKAVQTSSSGTHQCGMVEVSLDSRIYLLNCFYCAVEFPLCDWRQFAQHISDEHKFGASNPEPIATEEQPLIYFDSQIAMGRKKVEEIRYTSHLEFVSAGNREEVMERKSHSNSADDDVHNPNPRRRLNLKEGSVSPKKFLAPGSEVEEPNMPLTEPENDSTDLDQIVLFEDSCGSGEDDDAGERSENATTKTKISQNCIFFSRTDEAIVHHFLNLLRAYPVLWSWRRRPTSAYDGAIAEVTQQLNDRWSISFREAAIAESILRLRYWFTYVLQRLASNHKKYRTRFKEYFEKCAEFLPSRNLVQPPKGLQCTNCERLFRDAAQLRHHQYQAHGVGKLEFKCSRCDMRFAQAAEQHSHEAATHKRYAVLHYKCSECANVFYNKTTLRSRDDSDALLCASCIVRSKKGVIKKRLCSKCGKSLCNKDNRQAECGSFICGNCVGASTKNGRICDLCGKEFTTVAICKEHRLLHQKPIFNCDQCPKGYHRAFRLREHKRIHSAHHEFTCEECGRSFLRRKLLNEHIKGVHRRAINCTICGVLYTNRMSVQRHLRRDHLVLEGTNEELDRRMIPTKLKRVFDEESNSQIYVCTVCEQKFPGKPPFGLVIHMMKKHGYKPIDAEWRKQAKQSKNAAKNATAGTDATPEYDASGSIRPIAVDEVFDNVDINALEEGIVEYVMLEDMEMH